METVNEIIERIMSTNFAADLLIAAIVTTIIGGMLRYSWARVLAGGRWAWRGITWPGRRLAQAFKGKEPVTESLYGKRSKKVKTLRDLTTKTNRLNQSIAKLQPILWDAGEAMDNFKTAQKLLENLGTKEGIAMPTARHPWNTVSLEPHDAFLILRTMPNDPELRRHFKESDAEIVDDPVGIRVFNEAHNTMWHGIADKIRAKQDWR